VNSADGFTLDAQQRSAVGHPLSPLRIVAGAGSGKTEVMAQRVVSLVENGTVADHEILGLTFSNKAAANLRERVVRRLGPGNRVHVSTYHGFGAQIVGEHHELLGFVNEPRLLDRARAFQLLLAEFDRVDLPNRKTGRPQAIVDEALSLAASLADHLVSVDALRADCLAVANDSSVTPGARRTARSRSDLCVLLEAYAAAKRRLGLLDFGDQIALAVTVVRENPSIAAELRERYRAVLLDEFQDTNVAQRELLKLIWVDGFASGTSPLTAVGDDLQSIYGFRGAHVDNLIHFDRHVPGTTTIDLETNYRSGERIVALANHVQSEIAVALPKRLAATPATGLATIESFVAADDRAEAQSIARRIVAVGAPWREIAVLCRKRRLIEPIAAALTDAGVPIEIVGLGGLLTRPEIVDTVAWLRVLAATEADPLANVALLRLLTGPSFRIGLRDLAALSRADRAQRRIDFDAALAAAASTTSDDPLHDVNPPVDPGLDMRRVLNGRDIADLSAEAWARLASFRTVLHDLALVAGRRSLVDVTEAVIHAAGLWSVVDAVGHENLLRFLDIVHRFEPLDGPTTVASFLQYLDLVELSEDDPAEATPVASDAVQLMTIHQAKGLEFTTVFVPGLAGSGSSRIFPDKRALSNGATVAAALPHWLRLDNDGFNSAPHNRTDEDRLKAHVGQQQTYEELRLLYVAVTRARDRLVVSGAHWYSGPQKPQGLSEFYALLRLRTDLVVETERALPPSDDPQLAARRRRRDAARQQETVIAQPTVSRTRSRADSINASMTPLFDLRPAEPVKAAAAPPTVSATGVVTYAQCAQRFEWSFVRRLPRRSNPAATFGTAIHRWIEDRGRPQLAFTFDIDDTHDTHDTHDMEDIDDVDLTIDLITEPIRDAQDSRWDRTRRAFRSSPYAALHPQRVEAPFTLVIASTVEPSTSAGVIRGRIDAVYEHHGVFEIVDFKTGVAPDVADRSAGVQLEIYALVAVDQWGVNPATLRTSFCYLGTNGTDGCETVSKDWDSNEIARVRREVAQRLGAISAGQFSPHGGPWCRSCDFVSFCPGAVKSG
jgi:DNA helicase II / ATP-dependent DNA helicase PcrA